MGRPIWKGSVDLQLTPDSPEIYNSDGGSGVVLRYDGPYATVNAARPSLGMGIAGYPGSVVKDTRVQKLPGRRGRLTITAEVPQPPPPPDVILEIDWVRVTKPLETHSIFKSLSDEEVRKIKQAIQSPIPGESPDLTGPAQKLYEKLLRGQEGYDVWAPVVKRTTETSSTPHTGNCGMRDTPPISPGGSWEWLKTSDSARRQSGKWTRTEEWTGADTIDSDIYP